MKEQQLASEKVLNVLQEGSGWVERALSGTRPGA